MKKFFPCLLEGIPLSKTLSVEITQNENSLNKNATIEFIDYDPPSAITLRFAGTQIFQGILKTVDVKKCGIRRAYYETAVNCSDLAKTYVLTKEAFNVLMYNSYIRAYRSEFHPRTPINDPPVYVVVTHPNGFSRTYYVEFDEFVSAAGDIANYYVPPTSFRNHSQYVNFWEFIRDHVRLTASTYPGNTLVAFRVAHVFYWDYTGNNWATEAYSIHHVQLHENINDFVYVYIDNRLNTFSPYKVDRSRNIRSISDVFSLFGHVLRTSSPVLVIKPLILAFFPGDLVNLIRQLKQNIAMRIDEYGSLIGTDIDSIYDYLYLPNSVIFDYTLPADREISVTIETSVADFKHTIKIADYGCTINTEHINNDLYYYPESSWPSIYRYYKMNHQRRGTIKTVLLPTVEMYYKVYTSFGQFRVTGYTHRITKDEASTTLTVVKEVL